MITAIRAGQRFDSLGHPTIQVEVRTSKGWFRALVPAGASTGKHEAIELRDTDEGAFGGQGVRAAIKKVEHVIAPALLVQRFNVATQLKDIDATLCALDGTPNKAHLGANATLGVSMACARAGAAETRLSLYAFLRHEAKISGGPYVLPVPFFNVINGGAPAGNATMAFQEIMIVPTGAASFEQAMRMGTEVYHELKAVIAARFGTPATGVGDEGGFAPPIATPEQALDLLATAVANRGYTGQISFAVDPAASALATPDGRYDVGLPDPDQTGRPLLITPAQLQDRYRALLDAYPIVLLEDPFAADDWPAWTAFCQDCPVELVGDDLLATSVFRLRLAHSRRACNAMLLKLNQVGTVSEAIEAARLARSFGWSVFVSHRAGETTDDFIADLAVALATGHLKAGAPVRGERIAKYNRLLDIEAELIAARKPVVYAGTNFRHPKM